MLVKTGQNLIDQTDLFQFVIPIRLRHTHHERTQGKLGVRVGQVFVLRRP